MQMHAMNNFGNSNRGFGGQPQPQRQGPRRGNNRGGFRNTRFEQVNNQGNQRNQNQQNQGQRPNENKPADKPQNEPVQAKPQELKEVPKQQPGPQANKPPQNATPNKPAQQQPAAQNAVKPQPLMGEKVDKPIDVEQYVPQDVANNRTATQQSPAQTQQKPPQQRDVNGSGPQGGFQGGQNNRGSWGGPGNRQGGPGGPGNKQFGQRPQGGPRDGQGGPRDGQGGPQGGQGGPQGGQGGPQGGQGGPGGPQGGPGGPHGGQGGFGAARNQRQNNPRGGQHDGKPGLREEQMLANKLRELQGPIYELPPMEQAEVKFNGRCRLYIGNLSNDMSDDQIQQMFSNYGEAAELFVNKEKNFGFVKMDYRANAEKAKRELDGSIKHGKPLRVRFAPHNSAVRVKNLPAFVSNELLYKAFEIFGKIERAYVKVDERGKTLGEGVVEFARKPSALAALRNCTEKCFFLTSSLRPVIVESFEEPDEFDGYPEKNLPKKHPEFLREREYGPRFADNGSFEHEYGTRWKQLHELHRQKEEALKKELAAEEEKLEAQMEYAKYEHETEQLRQQLRAREQDRERQKRSWELAERAAEERRDAERAALQRQEEELSQRMRAQDDELRRRQKENTLFVQAQRLNSMLDRQEQGMYDSKQSPMDGDFRDQFDSGNMGMERGGGGFNNSMQRNHAWEGPRQIDDFPNNKRRRF